MEIIIAKSATTAKHKLSKAIGISRDVLDPAIDSLITAIVESVIETEKAKPIGRVSDQYLKKTQKEKN